MTDIRSKWFGLLVSLLGLIYSCDLLALPGDLDPTFSADGKLTTTLMAGNYGQSVIQQKDGKLVFAGSNGNLVRCNADGSLDTTFSGDGVMGSPVRGGVGDGVDTGYSLIQQSDGKLVVAGMMLNNGYADIALERFNSNGSPDTTFSGDGLQTTAIGAKNDRAYSVIQQADGKLVVAGEIDDKFALVRYKSDGSLDAVFQTTIHGAAKSVVQQKDGKLVAAGYMYNDGNTILGLSYIVVVRFNINGSLDTTFSGDGILTESVGTAYAASSGESIIQQKDGQLVVAAYSSLSYINDGASILRRYNSDGSSAGGVTRMTGSPYDATYSVIQQADGKLVTAGYIRTGTNYDFVLTRYKSDLSLDATFSDDGILTLDESSSDKAYSVIQQSDGKLVVAGASGSSQQNMFGARFESGDQTISPDFIAPTMPSGLSATAVSSTQINLSWIASTDAVGVVAYKIYRGGVLLATQGNVTSYNDTGLSPSTGYSYTVTACDAKGNCSAKSASVSATTQKDSDGDGVADGSDNCPLMSNASQANADGDSQGDACDTDDDNDGRLDVSDNCPLVSNASQSDTDGDGQGDACDADDDNDGVADASDAFPLNASASVDADGDGKPDSCVGSCTGGLVLDADDDNDGVADSLDAFPLNASASVDTDGDGKPNSCVGTCTGGLVLDSDDDNDGITDASDAFPLNASASVDTDGDGKPDSCVGTCTGGLVLDSDDDNDGITDASDAFPLNASASVDTDGDGKPDSCVGSCIGGLVLDSDDDNDGVLDVSDNCQLISNILQTNTDGDSQGDACDPDDDNDGKLDGADNCPLVSNATQTNTDGDSQGDACDVDDDNDSVSDVTDNCPLVANTNQLDWDADGLGDKCDTPVPMPADAAGDIGKDKAGTSVTFAGDFNNDGYGDYIIGIPGFDAPGVKLIMDAGRAEVISGKNGSVLAFINGTAAKDALGTAVAGGSDIDNDGYDDVVVGAPNAGATHAGSVTILYGPDGARTGTIGGAVAKSAFGAALALGDVNGDSRADILVGAPKDDDVANGLKDAGSVMVYSGDGLGVLKTFYGTSAKANAGRSVAAGDLNNDGNAVIIIGAPADAGVGSVKAYTLAGSLLLQKTGESTKAQFGKAVASGDVSGDGYDDVLVGAPLDDDITNALKDTGSITVFSGNGGGLMVKQYGATAKAALGNSVAAGDVNGDGKADLVAGAWKDDKAALPKAIKDTGSVSVWSGNGYTPVTALYGSAAKDYFGAAVSAGDINSDGNADLIIGIPGFDAPATKPIKDVGKVTVLSGAGL